MPPLTFGSIGLPIAADDLALPSLIGLLTRLGGVAIAFGLVVASYSIPQPLGCDAMLKLATGYFIPMVIVQGFLLFTYLFILFFATRGAIPEYEKRESVELVLYLLAFFYLFELGLAAYGIKTSIELFNDVDNRWTLDSTKSLPSQCYFHKQLLFYFVVISDSLMWLDFFAFIGYCLFTIWGFTSINANRDDMAHRFASRFRIGCGIAQTVTCGLFGTVNSPLGKSQEELAYRQVADVFTSFFHGTSFGDKFVVTDLLASVLLIRAMQLSRARKFKNVDMGSFTNTTQLVSSNKQIDSITAYAGLVNHDSLSSVKGPRSSLQTFLWSAPDLFYDNKIMQPQFETIQEHSRTYTDTSDAMERGMAKGNLVLKILKDAYDYRHYMLAIYGELLHIYMKPVSGTCDLLCAAPCKQSQSTYAGDRLHLGEVVLEKEAGISRENIVYAAFTNYVGQVVPYAIAIDDNLKSVVVMCRGTLSFGDLLTDAMIHPVELTDTGKKCGFDGRGHYAHGGMLKVALTIFEDMQAHGILHHIFKASKIGNESPKQDKMQNMLGQDVQQTLASIPERVSSYNLVVVGHSLGAAIASLLAMLLHPTFPKLRCIAYATPGCVMSKELCEIVSEWTSSIWFGKDMVVRLSWRNLLIMRGQCLDVIRRSKTNKYRVLASIITGEGEDELLYEEGKVPNHPFRKELETEIRKLAQMKAEPSLLEKVQMFIPGKLLHLDRMDDPEVSNDSPLSRMCQGACSLMCSCCSCGQKKEELKYFPILIEERATIADLLVSPRMLFDHFPDVGAYAIEQVYSHYKNAGVTPP